VSRDAFAAAALEQIPKILTLQDRNPHSPTYGCFDRNFWHYKIIDFPSGMSQEFTWPLALVFSLDLPKNPYRGCAAIREWVAAGIRYAARAAHPDGSCDDYFPFEKAAGAAAFSLLACMESYALLCLDDPELLAFFEKRADWLAGHHESGRLANHAALTILCLEIAGRLLGTNRWDQLKAERLKILLSWQNEEGWFQEYEGADPGYHTLTIGVLAHLDRIAPSDPVRAALEKAIRFASDFVHPDGSFGGEYTSRNTYNFFPHGFELAGDWMPDGLSINDRFLKGLGSGLGACYADDHIVGHHAWSYLLAWRHFAPNRPALPPRPDGQRHFPNAGLLIDRRGGAELYAGLNKGGVFKFFRDGKQVISDTQLSLRMKDGRTAVAHLVGGCDAAVSADAVTVSGDFGWAKQKGMTPFRLVALRGLMLTLGRFNPDFVRRLLQKLLIVGKAPAPFRFERRFRWEDGGLVVEDAVAGADWSAVESAGIGGLQTSIYVVMSRTFQAGQLQKWMDLTDAVRSLAPGEALKVVRRF
jgi:hypothetical protein